MENHSSVTILINFVYYYQMSIHVYYKLPGLHQSSVIGPDSLYCGKWRKNSKSHRDLHFDLTMPIVALV